MVIREFFTYLTSESYKSSKLDDVRNHSGI
jgi:hypothetical protein